MLLVDLDELKRIFSEQNNVKQPREDGLRVCVFLLEVAKSFSMRVFYWCLQQQR